jgi:predicted ribosomally synthesized peptide with nif11-like leader
VSQEQLTALLASLRDHADLREKLQGVADADAAVELAQAAGFAVSKEDFLQFQETHTLELSDEQLETVSGGTSVTVVDIGTAIFGCTGPMC